MPNELELRIARYLAERGGRAPAEAIARDVLGLSGASGEVLATQIERLVAPGRAGDALIRKGADGWSLVPRAAAAGALSCPGPPPSSLAVVVSDVPRGSFRPALVALATCRSAPVLVWPGDSPEELRRAARGRAVLSSGGRAEASAVAAWLRPGNVLGVFLLRRLLRRAGLEVPRVLSARKRSESRPEDADSPEAACRAAEARCREALGTVPGLLERLAGDGIEDWEDVHGWLENRPDFDFGERAFDRATLEALPAGPGVYRFYDKADRLVYVGKSRRLRDRVSSYFRASLKPTSRQARIAARAHRIDVQSEGSDLAAQVREASDIRRRKPALNTQRTVRERAEGPAWSGDRVIVLSSRSARRSDVLFVRDGRVVDRRKMAPGGAARKRAVELLSRYFFDRTDEFADVPGGTPGISRRSAEEAGRLLATWSRRGADDILSFDPTESAGPDDAARRLIEYLEAEPGDGAVFIR